MVNITIYVLVSVIFVSLVSLIGVVFLLVGRNKLSKLLLSLVSLSAGTLLGGAFLHLLPEAVEPRGFTLPVSLLVLLGVMVFFIIEKLVHMHQCHTPQEHKLPMLHQPHKYHLGIMNLFGDGVHNFVDGLIIAGSYIVSVPVGIAATIGIIFHEVPQEIADFGVLLYAGYSKMKALLFNFFSAAVAILGAVVGLVLGTGSHEFAVALLPFAAGGFVYIAGSNLIPELHKECSWKDSVLHLFFFLLGVGIMVLLRSAGHGV